MNTLIKVIIALACAFALMYFDHQDSKSKEKTNVGNNSMGSDNGNFRVRFGNISLHRICVLPNKQGSRRVVKCPACEWTRTADNRYMCKKIERIIAVSHIKKRKRI